MTETTVQEQKGDTSFWSPWAVFFLGILFAALNWWRMGKKGKAILFLVLDLFVFLLTSWMEFDEWITQTDHEIYTEISLARILLHVVFAAVLAVIMANDIKRFNNGEKQPVSVKWQILFAFWGILFVARVGSWEALDYGAKSMGECRFPRLQDAIYQYEFEQRTGLATLVLGRNDFDCNWKWDAERIDEYTLNNVANVFLFAKLRDNKDTFFTMSEYIVLHDTLTESAFAEIVKENSSTRKPSLRIDVSDPNASYSFVNCGATDTFADCYVALGYNKVVSEFHVIFSNFSREQIHEFIDSIISVSSTRILEYEAELP